MSEVADTQKHVAVQRASKEKKLLENLPDYAKYEKDGFKVNFVCKWKSDLDSKTLKWAFKLAERNVGPFYKTSKQGWQPKVKQADLNKNWARYLVAYNSDKVPVAYSMFRFDLDYGCSVLYCYEMQIDKEAQRKGLGTFMMTVLEKLAKVYELEKVVLTVLKNNDNGISFFRKIGYTVDDTSPDQSEEVDYEIFSKLI